jgi:hypothetical protein
MKIRAVLPVVLLSVAALAGAAAKIDPGVYEPYTKKVFPKAYARWGDAGFARINALRIKAAETVAKNPKCDRVEIVELSDSKSTPPNNPVVFVDCANMQRFYLSEKDVGGPVRSQSEKGKQWSAGSVLTACVDGVKKRLNFPGTMDRSWFTSNVRQAPTTGNWVAEFEFTAKNAFGAELPAKARCVVEPDGKLEVTINER